MGKFLDELVKKNKIEEKKEAKEKRITLEILKKRFAELELNK